jgi:hypothetical protein
MLAKALNAMAVASRGVLLQALEIDQMPIQEVSVIQI